MLLKRQSPLFNFEKLINFLLTIKIANGPMKNENSIIAVKKLILLLG